MKVLVPRTTRPSGDSPWTNSAQWATSKFHGHLVANRTRTQGRVACGAAPRVAEIHVALRSHGPAETLDEEELQEALTTLFGGCFHPVFNPDPTRPACVTTHFAVQ
jgi:hypothetical protein